MEISSRIVLCKAGMFFFYGYFSVLFFFNSMITGFDLGYILLKGPALFLLLQFLAFLKGI